MEKDSNQFDMPKRDIKDVLYVGLAAGVSAVPLVGGSANELMKAVFASPIEKRKDIWLQSLARIIEELVNKPEFTVESLRENEEFQSLCYEASRIALENHQEEKRKALLAALKDNAEGKATYDQASHRLKLIAQLLPVHMQILRNAYQTKSYPQNTRGAAIGMLNKGLDATMDRDLLTTLVRELESMGLIKCRQSLGSFDDEMSYAFEATPLANGIG